MQGISTIQPLLAKIRVENLCECKQLQMNSLRSEQGIFSGAQGIDSALQGICEIDLRVRMCVKFFRLVDNKSIN
jgi:hypothetical protein